MGSIPVLKPQEVVQIRLEPLRRTRVRWDRESRQHVTVDVDNHDLSSPRRMDSPRSAARTVAC